MVAGTEDIGVRSWSGVLEDLKSKRLVREKPVVDSKRRSL